MNRRRQILQHQQQRFHRHASNCDAYAFFNLLTAPELLQRVESVLPKYREHLFSPTATLSMFLAQAMSADRSCQNAVNDLSIKRSCGGMKPNSTRTGAYCKAREQLPVEMVSTLVRHTGASISEKAPSSWRWMGRPVRLVDGTTPLPRKRPRAASKTAPLERQTIFRLLPFYTSTTPLFPHTPRQRKTHPQASYRGINLEAKQVFATFIKHLLEGQPPIQH
ncbi:IS4 protein [Pseudomonas sp. R11-23-07]|nr:IS4 protein [Pseudomonas sp. R11-23-07]